MKNLTQDLNSKLKVTTYRRKACLMHPEYGYVGFLADNAIYTPVGGKRCLQDILDAGGFTDYNGMFFWNPKTNARYLVK